jgi:hypothetical protein
MGSFFRAQARFGVVRWNRREVTRRHQQDPAGMRSRGYPASPADACELADNPVATGQRDAPEIELQNQPGTDLFVAQVFIVAQRYSKILFSICTERWYQCDSILCPEAIYQCNPAEGRMSPRFWSGQTPVPLAGKMQKNYSKVVKFLYGPYFKVVGFFYRIYTANRARVERLKANQIFSTLLKGFTVAVLLAWILIWMFASDESRTRLVDDVRQSIGFPAPQATQSDPEVPAQ